MTCYSMEGASCMTLRFEMCAEREEAQGSPQDRQLHCEEVQKAQGG
jgi:hypothetical protein